MAGEVAVFNDAGAPPFGEHIYTIVYPVKLVTLRAFGILNPDTGQPSDTHPPTWER